jgi:hypothetical protein
MSIRQFEGFETVGTTTGSGDAANVKARLQLRYTMGSGQVYLVDDYESVGYAMSANAYNSYIRHLFPGGAESGNTYVAGCRFHMPDTSPRDQWVMAPRESAASFFTVVATASGDIEIQRPPVSTVIGTAVGVITPGNWHVIECKFIVASSPNGSVEVYVDGVQVLNLTGINTSYFGTNVLGLTWAGAYTTGAAPSGTGEDYAAYDDLYSSRC